MRRCEGGKCTGATVTEVPLDDPPRMGAQPADHMGTAPRSRPAGLRAAGEPQAGEPAASASYQWDAAIGRAMASAPLTIRIDLTDRGDFRARTRHVSGWSGDTVAA